MTRGPQPGQTISHYRVIEKVGEGGMGVVYKATDLRLDRVVALKFLIAQAVEDGASKERFIREAKASAALDHLNVCTVYEISEADGRIFLAMAFIEGERVSDRIAQQPLKLSEALDIAIQTAQGLHAAHEKGIVHRDIKSANLMINRQGQVKIMDFGIAQLANHTRLTQSMAILGTPRYISPEQAQGQEADPRSDIWSLGIVLYEMVTGRLPFEGAHPNAVLYSIVHNAHEPVTALRVGLPPELDRILSKALSKEPDERYQHADEFSADLRTLARQHAYGRHTPSISSATQLAASRPTINPSASGTSRHSWKLVPAVAVASMLAGAIGVWFLRPPSALNRELTRVLIDLQPAERVTPGLVSSRPSRAAVALSPDGRTVVFAGARGTTSQLFKRPLDAIEATPIPGTEGARGPFFSPDGRWIGFWAGFKLKKAPIDGGPPVEICDVSGGVPGLLGASWGSNDTIVFSPRGEGISKVDAGGGTPTEITKGDPSRSEGRHILPHLLPGGKALLYTVVPSLSDWEQANIVSQSLETGERRTLIRGGADARYVSTGHLLYMKSGTLMAVRFDPKRQELLGPPVSVLNDVMHSVNTPNITDETGVGQFSVAENGSLLYLTGGMATPGKNQLLWVNRKGEFSPLGVQPGIYFYPTVSPDGKKVAFHAQREQSHEYLLWIYDIGREAATRLILEGDNCCAVWSPDSNTVAFRSLISGNYQVRRISADGTRTESLIMSRYGLIPTSWSRLNILAYDEFHDPVWQIWILPLDSLKPYVFQQTSFSLQYPAFSPDGQWLAYTSSESGAQEVYVQPFPGPGEKIRISVARGTSPAWASNGRELFYQRSVETMTQMMAVDIDTGKGFQAGKPHLLFEGPYAINSPMRGYDVTPDASRFVMTRNVSRAPGAVQAPPVTDNTQLRLVLNWTEELKRRAVVHGSN